MPYIVHAVTMASPNVAFGIRQDVMHLQKFQFTHTPNPRALESALAFNPKWPPSFAIIDGPTIGNCIPKAVDLVPGAQTVFLHDPHRVPAVPEALRGRVHPFPRAFERGTLKKYMASMAAQAWPNIKEVLHRRANINDLSVSEDGYIAYKGKPLVMKDIFQIEAEILHFLTRHTLNRNNTPAYSVMSEHIRGIKPESGMQVLHNFALSAGQRLREATDNQFTVIHESSMGTPDDYKIAPVVRCVL
jgi:hypothetical protein